MEIIFGSLSSTLKNLGRTMIQGNKTVDDQTYANFKVHSKNDHNPHSPPTENPWWLKMRWFSI